MQRIAALRLTLVDLEEEELAVEARLKILRDLKVHLKERIARCEGDRAAGRSSATLGGGPKETNREHIKRIITAGGRPMKLPEILEAGRKEGHPFTSKNVVDSTLRKNQDRAEKPGTFGKVGRGRWTVIIGSSS